MISELGLIIVYASSKVLTVDLLSLKNSKRAFWIICYIIRNNNFDNTN